MLEVQGKTKKSKKGPFFVLSETPLAPINNIFIFPTTFSDLSLLAIFAVAFRDALKL